MLSLKLRLKQQDTSDERAACSRKMLSSPLKQSYTKLTITLKVIKRFIHKSLHGIHT